MKEEQAGLKFIRILTGGRNAISQLWRTAEGKPVVVKRPARKADGDRITREFEAIQFLRNHRIRTVPSPVARCGHLAVYEYETGRKVTLKSVTPGDIDRMTEFLVNLDRLSRTGEGLKYRPAREACLCPSEILNQIEKRQRLLSALPPEDAITESMQRLISGQFTEIKKAVISWVNEKGMSAGIQFELPLTPKQQTLSPSDFGFHNAVRKKDGSLVFVDFEYFGRDDPAKLISDTLLHPRMNLPRRLKQRFLSSILSGYGRGPGLARRVRVLYPLFGLKWSLILLNEFIPEMFYRRYRASGSRLDYTRSRKKQLSLSRQYMTDIYRIYRTFPYETD